jgi:hypothetical protein
MQNLPCLAQNLKISNSQPTIEMTEPVPKPGEGQPIVFFDLTLGG